MQLPTDSEKFALAISCICIILHLLVLFTHIKGTFQELGRQRSLAPQVDMLHPTPGTTFP